MYGSIHCVLASINVPDPSSFGSSAFGGNINSVKFDRVTGKTGVQAHISPMSRSDDPAADDYYPRFLGTSQACCQRSGSNP